MIVLKTIREQILELIAIELGKITLANGYATNIGQNVVRDYYDQYPAELPCVVMISDQDTADRYTSHAELHIPLIIEGLMRYGTHSPAREGEKILGDLITCMTAPRIDLDFTNGYRNPATGNTLFGAISGATCVLESVSVTSGSWAAHDAAGTFRVRLPWGTFQPENILNEGSELVAELPGTLARVMPFSDMVNDIEYQRGGMITLPDPGELYIKVTTQFDVHYVLLQGNPYRQS